MLRLRSLIIADIDLNEYPGLGGVLNQEALRWGTQCSQVQVRPDWSGNLSPIKQPHMSLRYSWLKVVALNTLEGNDKRAEPSCPVYFWSAEASVATFHSCIHRQTLLLYYMYVGLG